MSRGSLVRFIPPGSGGVTVLWILEVSRSSFPLMVAAFGYPEGRVVVERVWMILARWICQRTLKMRCGVGDRGEVGVYHLRQTRKFREIILRVEFETVEDGNVAISSQSHLCSKWLLI